MNETHGEITIILDEEWFFQGPTKDAAAQKEMVREMEEFGERRAREAEEALIRRILPRDCS